MKAAPNFKDLIKQRFNRLFVLRQLPTDKQGKSRWECKCDCGKIVIVNGGYLRSGHTKSCGCLRKDNGLAKRLAFGESCRNAVLREYKASARKKELVWNLADEQAIAMFTSLCYYCGSPPSNIRSMENKFGYYVFNGIDRKDNSIGYVPDNCVPCCSVCNYFKSTMSAAEYIKQCKKVANYSPN